MAVNHVIPAGYHFFADDQELLMHILIPRIAGQNILNNRIHDVGYINDWGPEDITLQAEPIEHNVWFFFTPRRRLYPNGVRPSRKTPLGFWKATSALQEISANGAVLGYKGSFAFYEGFGPAAVRGPWLMKEYTAYEEPLARAARLAALAAAGNPQDLNALFSSLSGESWFSFVWIAGYSVRCIGCPPDFKGTRFQDARNLDEEKDLVAER